MSRIIHMVALSGLCSSSLYAQEVAGLEGYAHALFGGIHGSDGGFLNTGYPMGYGGGLDFALRDNIAIRIVQFDWLPVRFDRVWNKSIVRFGVGFVLKGSPR